MNPATAVRRPLHPPPVPSSSFPFHPGSLLSVLDLTVDGVAHLLTRAMALEKEDPLKRDRILAKRRIALLFYESSTRTRTSFELAAKALYLSNRQREPLFVRGRRRSPGHLPVVFCKGAC